MERILRGLRAMTSVDITPGDTLVILDEVQDIPEVLEALKYFKEETPDYHIAVAGSLLGISLHENVSYPVGKVNVINLYPMSFGGVSIRVTGLVLPSPGSGNSNSAYFKYNGEIEYLRSKYWLNSFQNIYQPYYILHFQYGNKAYTKKIKR